MVVLFVNVQENLYKITARDMREFLFSDNRFRYFKWYIARAYRVADVTLIQLSKGPKFNHILKHKNISIAAIHIHDLLSERIYLLQNEWCSHARLVHYLRNKMLSGYNSRSTLSQSPYLLPQPSTLESKHTKNLETLRYGPGLAGDQRTTCEPWELSLGMSNERFIHLSNKIFASDERKNLLRYSWC